MTGPASPYPQGAFRRADESDDPLFYREPRLVVHIDDYAIEALRGYYRQVLPAGGAFLDLMSSWRSHLPDDVALARVTGLGLNRVELDENPQLTERVIHDLNVEPALPFGDGEFDAAAVAVSVQYMTRPVETFAEVNRLLKPGAAFHVIYSNRMFPTKAVALWQALGDHDRAGLIGSYFRLSSGYPGGGEWDDPTFTDITPQAGLPHRPALRRRRPQAVATRQACAKT